MWYHVTSYHMSVFCFDFITPNYLITIKNKSDLMYSYLRPDILFILFFEGKKNASFYYYSSIPHKFTNRYCQFCLLACHNTCQTKHWGQIKSVLFSNSTHFFVSGNKKVWILVLIMKSWTWRYAAKCIEHCNHQGYYFFLH